MNIKAIAKEVLEFLIYLIIMVAAVIALRHFVVESFRVDGHSMDYTLQHDERLFMWKLAKIERFDVVVIKAPSDPSKRYIKRVIGVPGDTIEVRDDKLYINGVATDEPYLAEKVKEYQAANPNGNFTQNFTLAQVAGASTVPEGKYFVLGDNRQNSLDGRSFGFIDANTVEGEADVSYWPLNRLGLLQKYKLNDAGQIVNR